MDSPDRVSPGAPPRARYREIAANRAAEALAKGYKTRHFFPHRFYLLPKCGPDGFRLAQAMCGATDPAACWEIVLYADPSRLADLPAELFFDDDLIWHQQQFGRPGQIASVDLLVDGDSIYTMAHVSDLVQRIGRRREHLTRVEKRFRGWHHMLLNSVACVALERGAARVLSPTAAWAMTHTDRARSVQPELFERVYDRDLRTRFPGATVSGNWWVVDAGELAARCLPAAAGAEPLRDEKTICLFHDTERGLGHRDVDPAFAAAADREAPAHLDAMLAIERAAAVRATYDVVGVLLPELRQRIAAGGHCLAFHSYDHAPAGQDHGQLRACRTIDYRLKGYRVPRSELTDEISDARLCTHNFEWLASSTRSLGRSEPTLRSGVVRIPIFDDDFPLHTGRLRYPEWEARMLDTVRALPFAGIGLHDCYAAAWLPHYPRFLDALRALGTLRTADEVASEVIFRHAA
ncbi:MAG: hypothetical protein U0802_22945 [Candidatus Binatia bacterium]